MLKVETAGSEDSLFHEKQMQTVLPGAVCSLFKSRTTSSIIIVIADIRY
jgi:hypothetical protein